MFPRIIWQYILVTPRTVDKLGVQSEDIYLAQFKYLLGIRIITPLTLDSDRIEFPMMTIFTFCGSNLAPYRPQNIISYHRLQNGTRQIYKPRTHK